MLDVKPVLWMSKYKHSSRWMSVKTYSLYHIPMTVNFLKTGIGWPCCHDFNTLRLRRNGQHFADDIFRRIFFNENVWISIKISLKCVPKGPVNNITALVQILAWRLPGYKPLSEPMVDSSPTHICVTRHQWVHSVISLVFSQSFKLFPTLLSAWQ